MKALRKKGTQALLVIAYLANGGMAVVEASDLAIKAEARVDELNSLLDDKNFDHLGLGTDNAIEWFDWKRAEKVKESVPTLDEIVAQKDATLSVEKAKEVIENGGNLLDLMLV